VLSAVCIVHCLAIPLIVAILPIAALGLGGGHFHGLMLWLVVPVSAVDFALGYRVHRRVDVVAVGIAAVALLMVAGIYGHDQWAAAVEAAVSVVASLILAGSHWVNFREVRRLHRHRKSAIGVRHLFPSGEPGQTGSSARKVAGPAVRPPLAAIVPRSRTSSCV